MITIFLTLAPIKNEYGAPILLFSNETYPYSKLAIHIGTIICCDQRDLYTIYSCIVTDHRHAIVYRYTNTIKLFDSQKDLHIPK